MCYLNSLITIRVTAGILKPPSKRQNKDDILSYEILSGKIDGVR